MLSKIVLIRKHMMKYKVLIKKQLNNNENFKLKIFLFYF